MDNFPSNANTQKTNYTGKAVEKVEEPQPKPKKIEKVVQGEVVRKKPSMLKRFKETFLGGDDVSIGEFILLDIVIPATKDMIADAVTQGVERRLFGESRGHGRRSGGGFRPDPATRNRAGNVDYGGFSKPSRSNNVRHEEVRSLRRNRGVQLDEIYLATRVEADELLERMYDLLERYEQVSVSDLNDMLGVTSEYTDEKIGWVDLRGSRVQRTSRGYLVDLPRPEAL